jgi:hypothetical protein
MVSESPDVVNSFFSVARLVPSLAFAMNSGISALQCAQVSYQPGTTVHASPSGLLSTTADPYVLSPPTFTKAKDSVDIYSLLPPLDERDDSQSKFGAQAIHVNTADRIAPDEIKKIRDTLQQFPTLWEDRVGRIIQPDSDWMQIPLRESAVIESKGRYRVSKHDEAVIDEVFDKARADGRMSEAQGTIPTGWPVFVVWQKGKGRPVVDLRGLNALVVPDAYPLPRQDEILEFLRGMHWISVFDLQKAFYQLMIALKDRWKTAVVTHRGQELFNVIPMGYISSPSHLQKTMDKVLYEHRAYAKCYIDDIVVFSSTFDEHLLHIRSVLSALADIGLTLNPDKCHVAHHSVKLLGHVVDRFGLSTMQEKTDAIANLNFPTTLRELEFFCGLSGFYRHFVARYAAICEPLQRLKTQLLRGCPREKRRRDAFSRSTKIITPTEIEMTSFQLIKDAMC